MSRPSSSRSPLERFEDVTFTWMEEWLHDVYASLSVIYEMANATSKKSTKFSDLLIDLNGILTQIAEFIERIEKL